MDNEDKAQLIQQIRQARSKFAAMAATYCLGVFNDSFFRQSAMLIAVSQGHKAMQGYVMAVFTLPYLLFAAPAGWLADRFSKRHVVIGAKILELVAMLCGAVGICTSNWLFIFIMVFIMGLQSAIFSPSLNGSIPELYPPSYVVTANAVLKAVVTAAILGGVASCGLALRQKTASVAGIPRGRLIVSVVIVSVSALGVLCSLGVPRRRAASPHSIRSSVGKTSGGGIPRVRLMIWGFDMLSMETPKVSCQKVRAKATPCSVWIVRSSRRATDCQIRRERNKHSVT